MIPEAMERAPCGKPDVELHVRENELEMASLIPVLDRLRELDKTHLRSMDETGLDDTIVSLCRPGIEGILDAKKAGEIVRATKDVVAEKIGRHLGRLGALAILPMQSPEAAAAELELCVRKLGFKGAFFKGYSHSVRHI